MIAETLRTASGRVGRDDPVAPTTGGPAGNAQLTAWTGLLLLVLSAAELITLINVTGLISWHIVLGTILIPPALLKTASTGWRIARYYRGNIDYRRAGPPPTLLRVLGPGVVLTTLGLLASGLVLVLIGPDSSRTSLFTALGHRVDWVTVHQVLFIAWGILTGLHVLARTIPALRLTMLKGPGLPSLDGLALRVAAIVAVAALSAVAAVLVLSASSSWRHHDQSPHGGDREHGSAIGRGWSRNELL
jgi:hypothetical protein